MNVNIKRLNEKAVDPIYGTQESAGMDLFAIEGTAIKPGETRLIPTGFAMEIPEGYVGLILARSGIATKRGLAPANKVGVIDSDYRGEIMVALHNHSNKIQAVLAKERIAQLMIIKYEKVTLNFVSELNDSERGTGGFGSTGTHDANRESK